MVPEGNGALKSAVDANAVHYRKVEDLQRQIERHMKVEDEEAEGNGHDW